MTPSLSRLTEPSKEKSRQARAHGGFAFIGLATCAFVAWRSALIARLPSDTALGRWVVEIVLATLEAGAAWYLISNIVKSVTYLRLARRPEIAPAPSLRCPPVAFIYLCCEDVDRDALESIARVRYEGPLYLVIHDDSRTPGGKNAVDRIVEDLKTRWSRPIIVLRRKERTGGKPGALNYVLSRTSYLHHFFVLCDSDSVVVSPDFLPAALGRFEEPRVAVVQFRNRGREASGGRIHRLLARSVDAFDVFARYYAHCGVMPFLGHNAMVRTEAARRVGWFTEGVLSDDIDFTLRLVLEGERVEYEPTIEFAECHPASYESFRLRCQKWAFGCMQVLGRHLGPALRSRELTVTQKIWLAEFSGFYLLQSLLIVYLFLSYVVSPLLGAAGAADPGRLSLIGGLVLAGILAPTLAHEIAQRRMKEWPSLAWCCALVYGSSAFSTSRGLLEYLMGRAKPWTPTNARGQGSMLGAVTWLESAFGLLLFLVPLAVRPNILLAPCSYVFVAIFLFAPLVHWSYRQGEVPAPARAWEPEGASLLAVPASLRGVAPPPPAHASSVPRGVLARVFRPFLVLVALLLFLPGKPAMADPAAGAPTTAASATATPATGAPTMGTPRVTIRGASLFVDGKPFTVKGIHYSPWPPGTGPGKNYPYPGEETLGRDFQILHQLHVNTLLVHDAPRALLDRASREGFMVVYTFTLNWQSIDDEKAFAARTREIAGSVASMRDAPCVLMWGLGNEIPEWVEKERGKPLLQDRLHHLRDAVAAVDPLHPITHLNWPITRDLDLPFLDVVSFNLYPAWPREVVVRGYGDYITQILQPVAAGRPLVISEFGLSTLEASPERQAETLKRCWQEIRSRAAGGVVFEFVDEWWKNYDNPVSTADYWKRRYDPNDEAVHDQDPEEYYGIYTAERAPRPAAAAVREMFDDQGIGFSRAWLVLPLALLLAYTIHLFRQRSVKAPSRSGARLVAGVLLFAGVLLLVKPAVALPQAVADAQTDYLAEAPDDNFGWSVANAGDVNGDGTPDLIIGAIYNDAAGLNAGKAYVYRGGAAPSTLPFATMTGLAPNDQFGVSVAGAGDVNGDGYADVIVGARLNDLGGSAAGAAFIYFGGPAMDGTRDVTLLGEGANDWFGNSVAGAGDVNGDGYDDVIVGAPYNDRGGSAAGAAYIYFGGPSMNSVPDVILVGAMHDDQFGWSVASAGDVDGDGYDDVIVGARMHCVDTTLCPGAAYARGRAYIFRGGPSMDATPDIVLDGDAANDWFGNTVSGIGDVNGDGYADVAVGAIYADPVVDGTAVSNAGTTSIYFGGHPMNAVRDALIPGEQADDQSGWAIAPAGDVDGDGRADFWTTAHFYNDPAASGAGKAYLYRGRTSPTLMATVVGEGQDVQLGQAVAGGRFSGTDLLADGLLGEVYSRQAGAGSGMALLLSFFCIKETLDLHQIRWTSCAPFSAYDIYRALVPTDLRAGSYGTCLQDAVTGNSSPLDPANPPLGDAFSYLVAGRTASIEGGLGFDSMARLRPNATPCP